MSRNHHRLTWLVLLATSFVVTARAQTESDEHFCQVAGKVLAASPADFKSDEEVQKLHPLLVPAISGDLRQETVVLAGSDLVTNGCLPQAEKFAVLLMARWKSPAGIKYVADFYEFVSHPATGSAMPKVQAYRVGATENAYTWRSLQFRFAPTTLLGIQVDTLQDVLTPELRKEAEARTQKRLQEIERLSEETLSKPVE